MIGKPLMVIRLAIVSSRTVSTQLPKLLGPSPDTSMTRRAPSMSLDSISAAPWASASLIDLRRPKVSGAFIRDSANA